MVVISASLPIVNELVTDLLGVLDVTTKSLPFCCISTTGLISLAILIVSSGNPAQIGKTGHFVMDIANSFLQQRHKSSKPILEGDAQVKRQILFWIPLFSTGFLLHSF